MPWAGMRSSVMSLARLEHGLVIAGEQVLDLEHALAAAAGHDDAGVERHQHRRQVHVRIAVGEIAADGRDIAHPHIGEPPHGAHDHSGAPRHLGGMLDVGERRQAPR